MQATLRPMSLGEILDRTFEIYRKNFLLFAGIAAAPALAMLAIHVADASWVHSEQWFGRIRNNEGARIARSWMLAYGFYHISGLLGVFVQPAFVLATSRNLFGKSNSILGSLRFVSARWWTYLWIAVLRVLAQLVVPEIAGFLLMAATVYFLEKSGGLSQPDLIVTVVFLFMAALFVTFLFIGTAFAFSIPAAALEEKSGWKALRRSWKLTRGSRWRIFIAWVMASACVTILNTTGAFVAWPVANGITAGHHGAFDQHVYELMLYFFYAMVGTVVGPLYPIAITLLYYDQRVRKEGLDVELMMQAAGLGTAESGPIPLLMGQTAGFESAPDPT